MKEYTIGFYNESIEDSKGLEECNIIFNNFEKLKSHLRNNDKIIVKSGFSLYGIEVTEMNEIINELNLNIQLLNQCGSNSYNKLTIDCVMGINEYIKNNKDIIYKLLQI